MHGKFDVTRHKELGSTSGFLDLASGYEKRIERLGAWSLLCTEL